MQARLHKIFWTLDTRLMWTLLRCPLVMCRWIWRDRRCWRRSGETPRRTCPRRNSSSCSRPSTWPMTRWAPSTCPRRTRSRPDTSRTRHTSAPRFSRHGRRSPNTRLSVSVRTTRCDTRRVPGHHAGCRPPSLSSARPAESAALVVAPAAPIAPTANHGHRQVVLIKDARCTLSARSRWTPWWK